MKRTTNDSMFTFSQIVGKIQGAWHVYFFDFFEARLRTRNWGRLWKRRLSLVLYTHDLVMVGTRSLHYCTLYTHFVLLPYYKSCFI